MATIARETADNVRIFTTEENHEYAMAAMDDELFESCRWVNKSDEESFQLFFKRVEQATAELDVVWLITPYGPPEVTQEILTFSPRCPSITLLHASSRFVPAERPKLSKAFTLAVKAFSEYLPAPIRGRAWNQAGNYLAPHILSNYDCVLPLYPPVAEYVRQNVRPDGLVDWFLYEFYQPEATVDHEDIQITVPGRIKESLRNYNILFDVLDGLNIPRERLTICLLGNPVGSYGEQVIKRCRQYERRGHNIEYYPEGEWIPGEEFAHQMARTDLVFAPITVCQEDWAFNRDRIKGQTATSGVIGDAVRIGRPLVMPEEFTVTPEFEKLITTYENSADATKLIESWASSETTRQKLQQRAEHAARQFSLEKQAQRFESLCRRTIEASNRSR